jgi:glycosyltransferase involved in cell wall biosynthesis
MKDKKNIFVFAYYSYKDPVFQSATLNYLLKLTEKGKYHFHLLTFEHSGFTYERGEIEEIETNLTKCNISWYRSIWHSTRYLKLIHKAIDLITGIKLGLRIVKKNNCSLIYSEGVVGASIAYFISRITKRPHVVHSYEPHADSMLDGGVWRPWSWEFRLLKSFENVLAKKSNALITGTNAYKSVIKRKYPKANILVIPSCIDQDKFHFDGSARKALRKKYGVLPDNILIIYLGKFGGMYMEEELFQFFANCEKHSQLTFKYWILSSQSPDWINSKFDEYGIPVSKRYVEQVEPDAVKNYLSAADIGVVAVRPFPSKRYCSPIKTGEYWACGLPILVPEGIGDDYEIVQKDPSLGISVESISTFELCEVPSRISKAPDIRSLNIGSAQLNTLFEDIMA